MPRLSIKTKLSAVISILVLAFGLFNLVFFPAVAKRQFRAQASRSMHQVAETASYALVPAMETRNRGEVARILEGVKNIPTFSFSAVFDETGKAVDSTPSAPYWVAEYARNDGLTRSFIRPQDEILVANAPIFFRDARGDHVGSLVLGFTTDEIRQMVNNNVKRALWVGGIGLLAAVALGVYFASLYIRPLERLTAAVQQVASGNFQTMEVGVKSHDELGVLSRSFEVMTNKLKVSRDEIELQNKLLESRVHERTGQLLETIWELEEIRANLEKLVQERTRGLEQSRAELEAWAGTLEDKVQHKTQELTEANDSLLTSLQKLQDLDRIKSEFLANMSHELRTPLNAVIGFSGLLMQERDGRVSPDVKVDLSIIHQNGKSLLGMIDSVLDLSKMEAGGFELELEPMDPFPVLDDVAALAAGLIGDRPIRFSLDVPVRQGRILGDMTRFKQVITNLVGNAIKFTEQGGVAMTAERSADRLKIAIRDTGIGMSEHELKRLFKPFQQVDGSITRRFGGTGLGLALSQRLVMAMDGQLTVVSEKGRGSTFTVDLPLLSEGTP
jgi:signal transduction histidine kinase/HAMP domain-containing protein